MLLRIMKALIGTLQMFNRLVQLQFLCQILQERRWRRTSAHHEMLRLFLFHWTVQVSHLWCLFGWWRLHNWLVFWKRLSDFWPSWRGSRQVIHSRLPIDIRVHRRRVVLRGREIVGGKVLGIPLEPRQRERSIAGVRIIESKWLPFEAGWQESSLVLW